MAVLSILIALIGIGFERNFAKTFVGAMVLFTPVLQFLTYEVRFPSEYYFYRNNGLSRITLWGITLGAVFINIIRLLF